MKKPFFTLLLAGIAFLSLPACNVPSVVVAPPPKGITRFRLNVAMVEVADRTPNNNRWDPGLTEEQMAPDLYYTISVAGNQVYKSASVDNKLLTQWLEKSEVVDVAKGQKIVIAFYDYDASVARTGMLNNADDFIGSIELTADELIAAAQTGKELSSGLVKKCKLQIHNLFR
jgi:C2 domain